MKTKDFQLELCKRLVARAETQHLPAKGAKRTAAHLNAICGAAYALELLGSNQFNQLLTLAVLVSARGAEVVDNIAAGKPI
jgi:hypothetical protein